ncbi:MAG: chorismate mutase [Deltaproteobacteria bacterium]|nr:chorismate mutase [Deltaproteobacteria bacterium]
MTLKDIREDIDRIDARILALLTERMERALLTRRLKEKVEDPGREAAVLGRVRRASRGVLGAEFSEDLYRRVLGEARALQARDPKTVGFHGEHGAYSEMAAWHWNAGTVGIPCREFSEIFDGVEGGLFDFGVVPVENSLGGLVGPVNEMLTETDLHVVGAVDMPVSHCLLALHGSDHREIRSVYSHPQALAQCRRFLARNHLDPVSFYDTAGAAKMIAQERAKGAAAVASRLAAGIYDLEVIKEDVQDAASNRTRFLVLAREAGEGPGNKCSAVFSTEDKAGALFRTLEIFARADINLTRIESVPKGPGDYAIFVDFEGAEREDRVKSAIEEAAAATREFRLLGCYEERKV